MAETVEISALNEHIRSREGGWAIDIHQPGAEIRTVFLPMECATKLCSLGSFEVTIFVITKRVMRRFNLAALVVPEEKWATSKT